MRDYRKDANTIVRESIRSVLPDAAVQRALSDFERPSGRLVLVAAGKAAWQMARAAVDHLAKSAGSGKRPVIDDGIVITKYGHVMGEIPGVTCCEAGHPVPDENGFAATAKALALVKDLTEKDAVLFLLSGGGSALFELPLIPGEELQGVTGQLLAAGADIVEINTIRKRLSAVKGGSFGLACAPARVYSVILSDVLGDRVDMIASGPAAPDASTAEEALAIADKYDLTLSPQARELLREDKPAKLDHVTTIVTGSVKELCRAAVESCRGLGYEPVILTEELSCEASQAGRELGEFARALLTRDNDTVKGILDKYAPDMQLPVADRMTEKRQLAIIMGGETIVHVRGTGLGGRNQELALAAAPLIDGLDATVFSFGSDGTDGPTDAAGGYVDGNTISLLKNAGIDPEQTLADNDSYHALQAVNGLIVTGPTGTNVNDVSIALI